jgi:hypothetical protein
MPYWALGSEKEMMAEKASGLPLRPKEPKIT